MDPASELCHEQATSCQEWVAMWVGGWVGMGLCLAARSLKRNQHKAVHV